MTATTPFERRPASLAEAEAQIAEIRALLGAPAMPTATRRRRPPPAAAAAATAACGRATTALHWWREDARALLAAERPTARAWQIPRKPRKIRTLPRSVATC
jgi:hypothetical protein